MTANWECPYLCRLLTLKSFLSLCKFLPIKKSDADLAADVLQKTNAVKPEAKHSPQLHTCNCLWGFFKHREEVVGVPYASTGDPPSQLALSHTVPLKLKFTLAVANPWSHGEVFFHSSAKHNQKLRMLPGEVSSKRWVLAGGGAGPVGAELVLHSPTQQEANKSLGKSQ